MIIGFGNNVSSTIASDITATQTTFSVIPGDGDKFANLLTVDISNPDTPHEIYAKITLTNNQQTVFEICHLTAVTQDSLTVIRGQEGTAAKGWALNDVVSNFATRGSEQCFVQVGQIQAGDFTAANAGGTENALTVNLPSTFFTNSSTEWQLRTPLVIIPALANTGPVTLQLTIAGVVVGTFPLRKGGTQELEAGDITPSLPIMCLLDGAKTFFTTINPANLYSKLGTAAFHDVQLHPTDNTDGAVLMNGSWGLGDQGVHLTDSNLESPQGHETVLFVQGGGSGDAHFGSFGAGLHLKYGSDATVTHSANLYVTAAGGFKVEWMMVDIATGAVTSLMQELYGTLNPPPSVDLGNYYTKAESDTKYQPKGDYALTGSSYTKAESDALYGGGITGFRMANYGATYGNLRDSSTTIMTGIYEDNGYDNPTTHEHRQAQIEIAGAWYNVAYV